MPVRKKVIGTSCIFATRRQWEKSWSLASPAPSQEMTTNCGGTSPGLSRRGFGWCGCGPVSAVDPSPIRRSERRDVDEDEPDPDPVGVLSVVHPVSSAPPPAASPAPTTVRRSGPTSCPSPERLCTLPRGAASSVDHGSGPVHHPSRQPGCVSAEYLGLLEMKGLIHRVLASRSMRSDFTRSVKGIARRAPRAPKT